MENLRSNYPALEDCTYLNSCSSGLLSKEVLAFRREIDENFQKLGSNFRAGVYNRIQGVKDTVATAFGADSARTALIPSCSHGLNMVLEALADGQKVLHLDNDYPSIIWPFESRHFDCLKVANQSYQEEELIKYVQEYKIDILAVSAVQYSNGEIIAPVNFNNIKAKFPHLLIIVDGTQFLGTASFNFKESGIDLFAASAFKWLCSGYGNGVMFISKQMEAVLSSKTRGYNTYKNPAMEGQPSIGEFFEPGHQDLLSFLTLAFQVKAHDEIGFDQIQNQIHQLKSYARHQIESKTDFEIITSVNPHLESGILSVRAPKDLVVYLNQHKLVCSYNRGLRLGIHFYNNMGDIDRLLDLMVSYNKKSHSLAMSS